MGGSKRNGMNLRIFLWYVCMGVFLSSCGNKEKVALDLPPDLPPDFYDFYRKFHTDSIFQMEHISFPLRGMAGMQMDGGQVETKEFSAEEWKFQGLLHDTSYYEIRYVKVSDSIYEEEILLDDRGLGILRRFAKVGEEWFLSFYVEPNYMFSK